MGACRRRGSSRRRRSAAICGLVGQATCGAGAAALWRGEGPVEGGAVALVVRRCERMARTMTGSFAGCRRWRLRYNVACKQRGRLGSCGLQAPLEASCRRPACSWVIGAGSVRSGAGVMTRRPRACAAVWPLHTLFPVRLVRRLRIARVTQIAAEQRRAAHACIYA